MPKKIGKLFSSAKSKLLGTASSSSSPKKSVGATGSSASLASTSSGSALTTGSTSASGVQQQQHHYHASTSAATEYAGDTEPILGPSTSRDSIATRTTVEAGGGGGGGSRSSSVGSARTKGAGSGATPSSSRPVSRDRGQKTSKTGQQQRGAADGAEEEDLHLKSALGDGGLCGAASSEAAGSAAAPSGLRRFFTFGQTLTATTGYNELYTEQKDLHQSRWWASPLQLGAAANLPVLFGTWDGVFITTVVHLFGVLSFLRIGWLVGNEGVLLSAGIVFGCLLFTTISLLAAIGIMERCAATAVGGGGNTLANMHHQILRNSAGRPADVDLNEGELGGNSGLEDPEYSSSVASARANVHLLISTVLGSRIAGAVSLVYCFGQAVSCALHTVGFTETFVQLVSLFIERHVVVDRGQKPSSTPPPSSFQSFLASLAATLAKVLMIEVTSVTSDGHGDGHRVASLQLTAYTYQIVSAGAILLLFVCNVLGVKMLFRLQSFLFVALVGAVLDFGAGLFMSHEDYGYGPVTASLEHLRGNLYPAAAASSLDFWSHLFTVVGVFFPSAIGVMAGVNMGADLQTPTRSIPVGSLSAIVSSYGLHLLFIFGLGLTASRAALMKDFLVAQHVSAMGLFFLCGLYMSALSSSLGSMYTAPRILQNLAQELHSFPVVRCFAAGRGPNKIPINALILFTLVTLTFVMLGGINVLAPIVTIPYLLTYATIEYAYFSMAMTFDLQISREKRFMAIATQLQQSAEGGGGGGGDGGGGNFGGDDDGSPDSSRSTRKVVEKTVEVTSCSSPPPPVNETTALTDTSSVSLLRIDETSSTGGGGGGDQPPPSPTPSMQHLVGYGSVQPATAHIKIKRRQSTKSSSDDEDGSSSSDCSNIVSGEKFIEKMKRSASKRQRHVSGASSAKGVGGSPKEQQQQQQSAPEVPKRKAKTIKQLMAAESDEDEEEGSDSENGNGENVLMSTVNGKLKKQSQQQQQPALQNSTSNSVFRFETSDLSRFKVNLVADYTSKEVPTEENQTAGPGDRLLSADPELAEIGCKTSAWYLRLMNRWIVLVAALAKLALAFFIAWHYALLTVAVLVGFYLLIGKTNPGSYPGVSEFVLLGWLKNFGQKLIRRKAYNGQNLVASYSYDRIVIPPTSMPNMNYQSEVLSRENTDYSSRSAFHSSTLINPSFN